MCLGTFQHIETTCCTMRMQSANRTHLRTHTHKYALTKHAFYMHIQCVLLAIVQRLQQVNMHTNKLPSYIAYGQHISLDNRTMFSDDWGLLSLLHLCVWPFYRFCVPVWRHRAVRIILLQPIWYVRLTRFNWDLLVSRNTGGIFRRSCAHARCCLCIMHVFGNVMSSIKEVITHFAVELIFGLFMRSIQVTKTFT